MTGRNEIRSTIRLGLSAVLVILMVCTALTWLGTQDTAMAKAKPTLSKKTITMKASTKEKTVTATLKVKHPGQKIKWSSDKPELVKIVKTKGKYKQTVVLQAGTGAGQCVIRAKAGKRTLKCRVTVRDIEIRPLSPSSKDLSKTVKKLDPSELLPGIGAPASPGNFSVFSEAVTNFSFQLLKNTLFKEQEAGTQNAPVRNLLVSPDSVLTALLMAENGAGEDSDTKKEMQGLYRGPILPETLQWELFEQHEWLTKQNGTNDILYTTANSIWARDGKIKVRQDFLEKNKSLYNASFFEAPFDEWTVNDMNNWVFNRTRNMIDQIVSDLDEDCRMVLLNAVAFEGQWAQPFAEGQEGTFTCADGTKKTVTMLQGTLEGADKPYLGLDCGTGFVKFYQGRKVAFVGLLPPDYMTAEDYLEYLSGEDFARAWDKRTDAYDVQIKIPEFKYDYDISMKKPLQDMGMKEAFTDDADFSLMREDTEDAEDAEDLKIGDVLHKTHIELDRMGTKAAAATAVFAERAGATPDEREKREVFLDRSFLYALVDTSTGTPLFFGLVNDPGGDAVEQ